MLRSTVVLLCLALLSLSGSALAASGQPAKPGSPQAIAEAKKHFERALESYKSGAYREAIGELEAALELDPEGKDLVYNLALVNEKLGHIDAAIEYFRKYQQMEDDPAEVARVEEVIQRLEGARGEVDTDEQPAEGSEGAPGESGGQPSGSAKSERGRYDGWVMGTGGVAVAAILVGTLYGVRALLTQPGDDEATGGSTTVHDLQDRADTAHGYAVVADVAFAIGIASGALAGGLYFLREPVPGRDTGQASVGLSLGGRF